MSAVTPTVLCILDGYGINPNSEGNAVALASTPTLDSLFADNPYTTLTTYGEEVGLPGGQMGNSEVGHMNIGAGRVVEQWLLRISRSLAGGEAAHQEAFTSFIEKATSSDAPIHVAGLFSDGGVHSHWDHLRALLALLTEKTEQQILLHLITDGRDVAPNSALPALQEFEKEVEAMPQVAIATVSGRFYAMDRDQRWERTESAYTTIRGAGNKQSMLPSEWVAAQYEAGTTDEFIEPASFIEFEARKDDSVVFFNFRTDRMRQLARVLCTEDFTEFERPQPVFSKERVLCFTQYDETFGLPFLYGTLEIKNHLGEAVSQAGLKQFRIAETEKYPHVTYFLNGGEETELEGEERVVVPSPRDVKTYDLKPEMSAAGVTEHAVKAISSGEYSLVVINYANCDMVGHTGSIEAAVTAVETVDHAVKGLLAALPAGGKLMIIADHGNAEQMVDYETGAPHTAHTTYPVPCVIVGSEAKALRDTAALCDVAPTVLELMNLEVPEEMTGRSILLSAK